MIFNESVIQTCASYCASRGIGAATALLAGARGYAVGINYRHDARAANAVVHRFEQAGGTQLGASIKTARRRLLLSAGVGLS